MSSDLNGYMNEAWFSKDEKYCSLRVFHKILRLLE